MKKRGKKVKGQQYVAQACYTNNPCEGCVGELSLANSLSGGEPVGTSLCTRLGDACIEHHIIWRKENDELID